MFRIDADSGAVLDRHDGWIWSIRRSLGNQRPPAVLRRPSCQLYVPEPWGLILTGILGLMMMAAVCAGILMHRHLVRDLFVAERPAAGSLRCAIGTAVSDVEHPLRLPARLHRLVLSFAGTIACRWSRTSPSMATRRRCRQAASTAGREPNPAPLAASTTCSPTHRPRRRPRHLRRRLRLGSRRLARLRLARAGRGWPDRRAEHVRRVRPGLPRPPPWSETPAVLRRHALRADETAALGSFAGLLSQAVWGALGVAMCFVILSGFRCGLAAGPTDLCGAAFARAVQVTGYGLRWPCSPRPRLLPVAPRRRSFFWTPWASCRAWRSRSGSASASPTRTSSANVPALARRACRAAVLRSPPAHDLVGRAYLAAVRRADHRPAAADSRPCLSHFSRPAHAGWPATAPWRTCQ